MASVAVEHRHHVRFYEDPNVLALQVATYLGEALRAGGAGCAIARPHTLAVIEHELANAGHDIGAARAGGRLVLVDASDVARALLADGDVPRATFRRDIAPIVQRLCAAGGANAVHVYGEIVDVLWVGGQRRAVTALEELWGELLAELPFALVCGYQLHSFDGDVSGFDAICERHDAVALAQPSSAATATMSRMLAQLEQRARSLELEVSRRTRLEQRMLALLDLTGQLAAATDHATIARLVTDDGVHAVGAVAAALWLVGSAGTHLELFRTSSRSHRAVEDERLVALAGDAPLAYAVRTGEPVFLGTLQEHAERFPAVRPRLAPTCPEEYRAFAVLPLVLDRRPIGGIVFTFDRDREFTASDRAFKAILARQCALALARVQLQHQEREAREAAERAAAAASQARSELARAYREERDAHLLADQAIRAREEILSVVSHDLRNPLGTILIDATRLLHLDAGRGDRVRLVADRIHRQAERMTRLIEDLVDFAGIQAGQLAIERKAHRPDEILAATTDIFSSIAHERGLRFEAIVQPELPAVECDSGRAVQVMSNLVANALKVTPKGGAISIGAEPAQDEIVFYVRDTGPGIEPDELPRVFERHWRSKHAQYKGAGLGLSIARGIVDAHGGRIWAESHLGAGTTFYFSFASQRNN